MTSSQSRDHGLPLRLPLPGADRGRGAVRSVQARPPYRRLGMTRLAFYFLAFLGFAGIAYALVRSL